MANVRHEYSVYSKKKGAHTKSMIVLKNATFEECVEFIKSEYKVTLSKDKKEAQVPGFIYPGYVKITGK